MFSPYNSYSSSCPSLTDELIGAVQGRVYAFAVENRQLRTLRWAQTDFTKEVRLSLARLLLCFARIFARLLLVSDLFCRLPHVTLLFHTLSLLGGDPIHVLPGLQ